MMHVHRCKNGRVKTYPAVVCSMCKPGEGIDFSVPDVETVARLDLAWRDMRLSEDQYPITRYEEVLERDLFDYMLSAFAPEIREHYSVNGLSRIPSGEGQTKWVIRFVKRPIKLEVQDGG